MMNTACFLLFGLLAGPPVSVPADSARMEQAHVVLRKHADYNEEITYYGKRNQYFMVRTFLKSGRLLRLDSYTLLPKSLPNGLQLDSLSRIIRFGPTKIMYPDGQLYISCEYKDDALHGPFMVFYNDGAVKRRAYYKWGHLRKSRCYTADGLEDKCGPFYQQGEFTGKPNQLSTYLKQKFDPVIDGERVRSVLVQLTINEIGQLVQVKASVKASLTEGSSVAAVASYAQQVVRNMPDWNPDRLNWKPALNDGVPIQSTWVLSVFRYRGFLQYNLAAQF